MSEMARFETAHELHCMLPLDGFWPAVEGGAQLMSVLELREGLGSFVFSDTAASSGSLRVFFFCPKPGGSDSRIVVAMHGFDRAASDFRDALVSQASRSGQIVLVPGFDKVQFPDSYAYNYGNVVREQSREAPGPRKLWNFGIVDRLFEEVRDAVGSKQKSFGLFGNSAGAQFVLRYLALTEGVAVEVGVAANSGWYMLPDLSIDYPVGMGGLDLDESYLRRYLGRRLIVLLGDADTDSAAFDLPRNEAAMAQGPHRLARGLWHFDHCKRLADRLGTPFGWTLEIVPGAGHVDQGIYDRAALNLAGR